MKIRKGKRAAIYVRVSTMGQKTDSQEHELCEYAERRGWTVYRVYRDHGVSGSEAQRPALEELMQDCQKRKIEVLLVWKFDRFARSLRHLITALEEFRSLGIDFVSLTEAVDTSSSMGELVFNIFGAIAQFERNLIGERTRAALREARRKGKRLGRPPAAPLSEKQTASIMRERRRGRSSLRTIARKLSLPLWRVHAVVCGKARV